ncbi:DUF2742 domain-containing protein [Gordonia sp. NPDC003429]
MTDPITWGPVRDFVYRVIGGRTTTIIAGTPEWIALDDADPAKTDALITAGSRWVLEHQLDQLDEQRAAAKATAIDISQARDWSAVAQRIRDRDQWRRDHPDLERRVS